MKATIVQGPITENDPRSGKVRMLGAVVEFTHTTIAGKTWEWKSGVWLDANEIYKQDGSKKTSAQLRALLEAKVEDLAVVKQAEWDAIPANPVQEREELDTWKNQEVPLP